MYQILKNYIPTKTDKTTITVTFETKSQKQAFLDKIKSKIVEFIIQELNISIKIDINISENIKSENKIYTQSDKFTYLSDKNKNLLLFKDKFHLDFE